MASVAQSLTRPLGKFLFWRGATSRGEDGPWHLLRLLGSCCFILWVCTYKTETSPVNSAVSGLVCMQQPARLWVPSPSQHLQQPLGSLIWRLMPHYPQILSSQKKSGRDAHSCPPYAGCGDTAQPGTCCPGTRTAGAHPSLLSFRPVGRELIGSGSNPASEPLRFFSRGKEGAQGGDKALAGWILLWINAVWGHPVWCWPQHAGPVGWCPLCPSWESLLGGCGFQPHFCQAFSLPGCSPGSEKKKSKLPSPGEAAKGVFSVQLPVYSCRTAGYHSLSCCFSPVLPKSLFPLSGFYLCRVIPSR